jgi:TRAP-type C4-dicarboxylate transport system permease small subunit
MIVRLYDRLLDAMASAAVILLFGVMVGIGVDVAARYMFGRPIGWVYEFVQHSMLLILFLGLPWLTRQREHVSVDIVVDAVSQALRRVMLIAGSLLSALVCGHLARWALASTHDNFTRNVLTDGIYPVPRWWLIGVIALGLTLTTIELVRIAIRMVRDPAMTRRSGDAEVDSLGLDPAATSVAVEK